MSSIFISHSSHDERAANELKLRLADRAYHSVFLDFDPEAGIPAGRDWEKELYARLRACRALIVLCSRHSMASRWCFAEITHAKALGKHIFPIRIDDAPVDDLLTDRQVIDATGGWENACARLWAGLLSAGLDPGAPMSWDPARPPYPGLLAFQEEDAAIFFGREAEIRGGLDLLHQLHRFGGPRLVLVLGASGSGKSSLMRAGLLPRLGRDASTWLPLDPIRPLGAPFVELAHAIAAGFGRAGRAVEWEEIHARLVPRRAAAAEIRDRLAALVEELRDAAGGREATVVLSIDQCEELLGTGETGQAERFLPFLAELLRSPGTRLLVIGTLRSDFLATWQDQPGLQDIPFETLLLGHMAQESLAQVISGPAEIAGIQLEAGLVPAMVADTGTADALPLLAFALRELWERHGGDGFLEVREYRDALGGLEGSVARAAEAVLRAHVVETGRGALEGGAVRLSGEDEAGLREALLSMVRVGDEGRFARRSMEWSQLPAHVRGLLQRFVAARLLVPRPDGDRVEVAHEALFRAWQRLVRWLDADREFLVWRRRLDEALNEWERRNRHPAALLAGPALAEALAWRERHEEGQARLAEGELEFVRESDTAARADEAAREEQRLRELEQARALAAEQALRVEAEQSRVREQVRAARRLKWRFWFASALALVAIVASASAWGSWRRASAQRDRAIALALAQQSLTVAERERALLLAVAAVEFDDNVETRGTLIALLQGDPAACCSVATGVEWIDALSVSSDGTRLAAASQGSVLLWDLVTRRPLDDPLGGRERGWIESLAFSPDGRSLAVTDSAGGVRLWKLGAGPPRVLSPGGRGRKESLAFTPDGKHVVTDGTDGWVRFWSVAEGGGPPAHPVDSLQGHQARPPTVGEDPLLETLLAFGDQPLLVAFSADGKFLAAGSPDRPLVVWDLGARRRLPLRGAERTLYSLAFVSSENLLAVRSTDGTLDVLQASTGEQLGSFFSEAAAGMGKLTSSTNGAWVVAADFGTAASDAAAADRRRRVRVWNLTASPSIPGEFRLAALSPDAGVVATAGDTGVRLWRIGGQQARALHAGPGWPCPEPCLPATALAFSGDGQLLAEGSEKEIRVRRVADGVSATTPFASPAVAGEMYALVLGPRGRMLAASWDAGPVLLWRLASRSPRAEPLEIVQWGGARNLLFNPDESLLAVPGHSGTVDLWDTDTGRLYRQLLDPRARGSRERISAIRFSPDGGRLYAADATGEIFAWEIGRPEPVSRVQGQERASRLVVSQDGRMLAVATSDGIQLRDAVRLRAIGQPLIGSEGELLDLAFSADGGALVAVSESGRVTSWDVGTAVSIERACRVAGRDLTPEEWRQYVSLDLPQRRVCAGPSPGTDP